MQSDLAPVRKIKDPPCGDEPTEAKVAFGEEGTRQTMRTKDDQMEMTIKELEEKQFCLRAQNLHLRRHREAAINKNRDLRKQLTIEQANEHNGSSPMAIEFSPHQLTSHAMDPSSSCVDTVCSTTSPTSQGEDQRLKQHDTL